VTTPYIRSNTVTLQAAVAGPLSFEDLILERNALRVVFLEPFFRGVRGGEDLDVLGIANVVVLMEGMNAPLDPVHDSGLSVTVPSLFDHLF
jgi:hypothetical protein